MDFITDFDTSVKVSVSITIRFSPAFDDTELKKPTVVFMYFGRTREGDRKMNGY